MTLLPSSDFGIRGHEGKAYPVNVQCAHPFCGERSVHAHHLWSRSYLRGQPYEWVNLPDGTLIGNRVGLCIEHHDNVTGEVGGYRAMIAFSGGIFWWDDRAPKAVVPWSRIGPLDPQPPGVLAEIPKAPPAEDEVCPTCGHHKKQAHAPGMKRNAKTWTIDVPADAEIGADILDEWVLAFAEILGFQDERSRLRRYHAVATVLAWANISKAAFIADIKEAAAQ